MNRLEDLFPRLADADYGITSPANDDYNCLAWAAGETDRWWEPAEPYFWPDGVREEHTINAWREAFRSLGYSLCDDESSESVASSKTLCGRM